MADKETSALQMKDQDRGQVHGKVEIPSIMQNVDGSLGSLPSMVQPALTRVPRVSLAVSTISHGPGPHGPGDLDEVVYLLKLMGSQPRRHRSPAAHPWGSYRRWCSRR
ncbi:unnamed protein product [Urochloa humidicola]